jgi:F0F1-type ATP synthase assembly protein I
VEPDRHKQTPNQVNRQLLFRVAGLGMELIGGISGCVILGWWIDRAFGTGKVAVVTGAVIGCVVSMYVVIVRAMQLQKLMTRHGNRPTKTDESDRK